MKRRPRRMWPNWSAFRRPRYLFILNNSDKITFSSETKERVLTAAQQLGYKLPQRKSSRRSARATCLVLTPP